MTERDIPTLILSDEWMISVLRAVRTLSLPDWWIGAGFVRNKIWDELHGFAKRTPLNDIDVVYFDPTDISEMSENTFQKRLETLLPTGKWSVTNQACMHLENGDEPHSSSLDAMKNWPETATAVGVTLGKDDQVKFEAVHGAADLLNLTVRPTPAFERRLTIYRDRLSKKNWLSKWPKLRIIELVDRGEFE